MAKRKRKQPETKDVTPPAEDEAPSSEREKTVQNRKRLALLVGIVLFGAAGYYFLWRKPGSPCSQSIQCRGVEGFGEPECRYLAGPGKLCTLSCSPDVPPENACPLSMRCSKLVWEVGGEARTGFFCLP
jgi:hypothetical protein